MKATLFLALLLPSVSFAETYFCVAEAAAFVEDGADRPAISGQLNPETLKYVLTQENSQWVVKLLGEDTALFDKCTSGGYFCERSDDFYGGVFVRTADGLFANTWLSPGTGDDRERMNVAKGKCSLI